MINCVKKGRGEEQSGVGGRSPHETEGPHGDKRKRELKWFAKKTEMKGRKG